MVYRAPYRFTDQAQIVDPVFDDGIFRQRLNARPGRLEPLTGRRQLEHLDAGTTDINTECQTLTSAKKSHRTKCTPT